MSNSVNGAIDYFTKKKFGVLVTSLTPALANISHYKNSDFPKQAAEIEEFKATLRKMPVNELLTLHKQSILEDSERARKNAIEEEKNRFYNQQEANADFVHWSKAAHWSLDEAVALSFGKEPEHVNWKKIEPLEDKTTFAKAYARRRDLALRAPCWKKFGDSIPPVIFISWAKEINIELPNALIEEVTKIGGAALNWHEQYLKLKADYDILVAQTTSTQKPESTRKSNNILQAFTAIAIDAYGYDPRAEKSTAPQDIANALDKLGAVGNPKTIRSWLREGVELLPSNPHKD